MNVRTSRTPGPFEPLGGAAGAPRVAVIIPCYNEERTVGHVVEAFRASLPEASVYVCDNASTDDSVRAAQEAGALVRHEPLRGKGNVIRRMFADLEADIYLMVDGDGTYDPASAPTMIEKLQRERLDMVTAVRESQSPHAYRAGHRFGNRLFTRLVRQIFGSRVSDVFSGYRVFSRRFVKSFPAQSHAFEIETELTVHALELRMPIGELTTPYGARPEGSHSKLSTYRDGLKILWKVFELVKNERPMPLFGAIAAILLFASILFSLPIFATYLETGLVPRIPTVILIAGLFIAAVVSFVTGLIIDSTTRGRREMKHLHYLAIAPWEPERPPAAERSPRTDG